MVLKSKESSCPSSRTFCQTLMKFNNMIKFEFINSTKQNCQILNCSYFFNFSATLSPSLLCNILIFRRTVKYLTDSGDCISGIFLIQVAVRNVFFNMYKFTFYKYHFVNKEEKHVLTFMSQ